jgi:predicted esterase
MVTLADGLCAFDGGRPIDGRRTLIVYLHGALKDVGGAAYVQQKAMMFFAKREGFTVLFAAAPESGGFRAWPRAKPVQEAQEPYVVRGLQTARALLETSTGETYDETYVAGFSSGAYYAGSLALRGALDVLGVDGYLLFAGGTPEPTAVSESVPRVPVFVGVAAGDKSTCNGSRSLAAHFSSLEWPSRSEEQNTGHLVDWTLMTHGLSWLRDQKDAATKRLALGKGMTSLD